MNAGKRGGSKAETRAPRTQARSHRILCSLAGSLSLPLWSPRNEIFHIPETTAHPRSEPLGATNEWSSSRGKPCANAAKHCVVILCSCQHAEEGRVLVPLCNSSEIRIFSSGKEFFNPLTHELSQAPHQRPRTGQTPTGEMAPETGSSCWGAHHTASISARPLHEFAPSVLKSSPR